MSEHYDDADVEVVSQALYIVDYGRWTSGPDPLGTPWGTSREQRWRETYRADARTVLDAVAPQIAAKAHRDAAKECRGSDMFPAIPRSNVRKWLGDLADEIDRGRS